MPLLAQPLIFFIELPKNSFFDCPGEENALHSRHHDPVIIGGTAVALLELSLRACSLK